jgi:hypothetical protein
VIPERRFAYAAFGNSTAAEFVHERMNDFILREIVGLPPPARIEPTPQEIDPAHFIGSYSKQYINTAITPGEDGALTARVTLDYPGTQRELFREYTGRDEIPPFPIYPVTSSFCVPGALATEPIPITRMARAGLTFIDPDERGDFRYLSSGLRIARRVD